MTTFDIVETERLVLRRWREADREHFAACGLLSGPPGSRVWRVIVCRSGSREHLRSTTRNDGRSRNATGVATRDGNLVMVMVHMQINFLSGMNQNVRVESTRS
jgi:hypothetical protein